MKSAYTDENAAYELGWAWRRQGGMTSCFLNDTKFVNFMLRDSGNTKTNRITNDSNAECKAWVRGWTDAGGQGLKIVK